MVSTQTSATAAWTGVADIPSLHDGQEITYWRPYGSMSNVTLTLTLLDETTTEAIPCNFGGATRLGSQYAAGNIIHLTYRENAAYYSTVIPKGWWTDANYNTDTYDRVRAGAFKAKTALLSGRLIVGDDAGYFHLAAGVPFKVGNRIRRMNTTPDTMPSRNDTKRPEKPCTQGFSGKTKDTDIISISVSCGGGELGI